MKPATSVASFLLLLFAAYLAFRVAMPAYQPDAGLPESSFSTDRALEHLRQISQKPHGVGFPAHAEVRDYIMEALEGMGLKPELQTGYTAGDWGNLSKAENILVRIPGREPGRALLLLSHYDSSPHSSLGAGDAGSGIAVILEGLRAYLAGNRQPGNDLIVLISDAEELELNGADLFVNSHSWAREVGLVLNFEARGSGGPGIMLVETNGGNARLIDAFAQAAPPYPVANSLAYSIYKKLPNDTDLTVFREDGDIQGFNFAFIDDHFDYHTALDTWGRLDRNTVAHQGSYLVSLLDHFSDADLAHLRSADDYVYFNLPFLGLMHYPNAWIWPVFLFALLLLLAALITGFRKGTLTARGIAFGFVPALAALGLNGLLGYYAWPLLKAAYPAYADMLHGFTYNGYLYIAALAALACGSSFLIYGAKRKGPVADALVAPALIWLLLCGALSYYLPGAAFFVLPGISLIACLLILVLEPRPNPYLFTMMGVPALWIFAPLVELFPVGLGLKMLVAASLLSCLIFLLLLGIFLQYPQRRRFGWLGVLVGAGLLAGAHWSSGFSPLRPKPTSLLYVMHADSGQASWATYEKVPSDWTRAYLGSIPEEAAPANGPVLSSKYSTGFSFVAQAPSKNVLPPLFSVNQDTVVGGQRLLALEITSQRPVNRLEIFTNDTPLDRAAVNGIGLSEAYLQNLRGGKLITHFVSDNDPTRLELAFPEGNPLVLTVYEASNDLLTNPLFSVPPRPADQIPMPFVLNDAILVIKSIRFE